MNKQIGLVQVDVPPDALGLLRFIVHHCELGLTPIAATSLRDPAAWECLSAIVFPGGGAELFKRDLGDAGIANLKAFVAGGGGCVGICAGCTFLVEEGLLTANLFTMPGVGIYRLQNRQLGHPVFHDAKQAVALLRINGPFIEVASPTVSLADYDPAGRYACIVANEAGGGRVVGFSAHPEGGLAWGGGDYNPYFYYDGKHQRTVTLLHNALAWVAPTA